MKITAKRLFCKFPGCIVTYAVIGMAVAIAILAVKTWE